MPCPALSVRPPNPPDSTLNPGDGISIPVRNTSSTACPQLYLWLYAVPPTVGNPAPTSADLVGRLNFNTDVPANTTKKFTVKWRDLSAWPAGTSVGLLARIRYSMNDGCGQNYDTSKTPETDPCSEVNKTFIVGL